MSSTATLLNRNLKFASNFSTADLPIMPKLRTVLLSCVDARVEPAHILGLELGDAVVMRNNGARVTPAIVQEIATIAFMSSMMDEGEPKPFELVIMQHTQCGAERFANPQFQQGIKEKIGIDVAPSAITDHETSLQEDVERLRRAPEVPGYIIVSGLLYDIKTGQVREVIAPAPLRHKNKGAI